MYVRAVEATCIVSAPDLLFAESAMASTSQTDSLLMRRIMREGAATRPTASRTLSANSDHYAGREIQSRDQFLPDHGLEEDVALSIRSIERVVENFGVLKENFHFYKDLVADLKAKLDEETSQREEINREVIALERAIKSERERATRAEHVAKTSEGTIRDLESQLASLQAQTSRLVKAISLLVSAEVEVRDEENNGSLRLVS